MADQTQNVVEVKNLCKYFPIKAGLFGRVVGHVHAVEDVSFNIKRGTTMGLFGCCNNLIQQPSASCL